MRARPKRGLARAGFDSIAATLRALRAGSMAVVVDDEDRENEGDFVMAAEKVTPEDVNFLTREARGLLCVSMPGPRLEELGLALMTPLNTARFSTPFTISVDLLAGTTSGSSTQDRALTIRALASPKTRPEELARPGHVFPLRAADQGVLSRAGHTEAALDLVRLAGLKPAAVLCEILSADGTMARGPSSSASRGSTAIPSSRSGISSATGTGTNRWSSASRRRGSPHGSGISASWSTRAGSTAITTSLW
jgi:3,4-dihydroxy 2-butanone 4-phosphate synthase/GTP cyclohydrolase II